MEFTIFKKWDALLVQYALRIMVMYLWENLKEPIYIYLVPCWVIDNGKISINECLPLLLFVYGRQYRHRWVT